MESLYNLCEVRTFHRSELMRCTLILKMKRRISCSMVLMMTAGTFVNALQNLAVRDDGENAWSVPGIGGVGDFLNGIVKFGQDQLTGIEADPLDQIPLDSQKNQPPPVYKLQVSSDKGKCEPDSKDQCPAGHYLIYPLDCAGVQNSEVPERLITWNVMYKTSLNRQCGGTFFWLAYGLSLDQVESLK